MADRADCVRQLAWVQTFRKGFLMKRLLFGLHLLLLPHCLQRGVCAQEKPKERGTLQNVKDRGTLSCGVSQGLPGFSAPDDKGNWTGLDVDVCRAIAAAIFGDPTK